MHLPIVHGWRSALLISFNKFRNSVKWHDVLITKPTLQFGCQSEKRSRSKKKLVFLKAHHFTAIIQCVEERSGRVVKKEP